MTPTRVGVAQAGVEARTKMASAETLTIRMREKLAGICLVTSGRPSRAEGVGRRRVLGGVVIQRLQQREQAERGAVVGLEAAQRRSTSSPASSWVIRFAISSASSRGERAPRFSLPISAQILHVLVHERGQLADGQLVAGQHAAVAVAQLQRGALVSDGEPRRRAAVVRRLGSGPPAPPRRWPRATLRSGARGRAGRTRFRRRAAARAGLSCGSRSKSPTL